MQSASETFFMHVSDMPYSQYSDQSVCQIIKHCVKPAPSTPLQGQNLGKSNAKLTIRQSRQL